MADYDGSESSKYETKLIFDCTPCSCVIDHKL